MAVTRILKHTATVYAEEEFGAWVEGEPNAEEVPGATFKCALFTPDGNEGNRRGREVKEPTLLFLPRDDVTKDVSLGIVALEQNVLEGRSPDAEVRWQVVGSPRALGRPGRAPKVMMVTVRRVED